MTARNTVKVNKGQSQSPRNLTARWENGQFLYEKRLPFVPAVAGWHVPALEWEGATLPPGSRGVPVDRCMFDARKELLYR
jgi:hypothetical protein